MLNLFLLTFVLQSLPPSAPCSSEHCESSSISFTKDRIKNHELEGNVVKSFPVGGPMWCHAHCFHDWRCVSFQVSGSYCQLSCESRLSSPKHFKPKYGVDYYDMTWSRQQKEPPTKDCNDIPCSTGCCRQNPCLNSGRCTELCVHPRNKFHCACPRGFTGRICQIRARSCGDYPPDSLNGEYVIHDKFNGTFSVWCDFTSENDITWTLIESFALSQNDRFKTSPFYDNLEINENNFSWEAYRLSHTHMAEIAHSSTHFRATCNFPAQAFSYVDYLRAKLSDIDLLNFTRDGTCETFEYINIRGHDCHNCTALFGQRTHSHAQCDSFYGPEVGCQLASKQGAVSNGVLGEDNFGTYAVQNPAHRCTNSLNSTTQWWLG